MKSLLKFTALSIATGCLLATCQSLSPPLMEPSFKVSGPHDRKAAFHAFGSKINQFTGDKFYFVEVVNPTDDSIVVIGDDWDSLFCNATVPKIVHKHSGDTLELGIGCSFNFLEVLILPKTSKKFMTVPMMHNPYHTHLDTVAFEYSFPFLRGGKREYHTSRYEVVNGRYKRLE